jgi:sigma-B regulation protein RsbU (phosphoserine phosphatase)
MPFRLSDLPGRLGRLEQVFLLLLLAYLVSSYAAPGAVLTPLLALGVVATGLLALIRLARRNLRKLIWRLRNRLIVAYLFIAVVPLLLVFVLAGIAAYAVVGQMATYLVNTELNRRLTSLNAQAAAFGRTPANSIEDAVARFGPFIRDRFPEFEVLITGAREYRYPPDSTLTRPEGWPAANGLILREGRLCAWAHVLGRENEVTIVAPVTHDLLVDLLPGFGDVTFLRLDDRPGSRSLQLDQAGGRRSGLVPPPVNTVDFQIRGFSPVVLQVWESPSEQRTSLLIVTTRPSTVLSTVFGQKLEWDQVAFGAFVFVAVVLLIVEILSVVKGISLTRTITGAVHELYMGTQRVKEGDFSHRIPVHGDDQLAELTASFNTMTENLGRLILVAKEKERLQSELEIAKEVQTQLFPKSAPRLRSLEITGVCHPARMVSGDYYDFMTLSEGALAFAIGDVAGKGISAALLMAAIQSTMRTQLTAGIPVAAAAGNGGLHAHISTADIVSQLNKQLYANTAPEKYATFCFGIYDEPTHTLAYTNAGHLPPLVISGGEAGTLEVTGTVVGAFPWARYEERSVRLSHGDVLVAYTDGIVEPENEYGEAFGEERLHDLLVKHASAGSEAMIARTMEAVRQWTGSSDLQDDMTMIVARRV